MDDGLCNVRFISLFCHCFCLFMTTSSNSVVDEPPVGGHCSRHLLCNISMVTREREREIQTDLQTTGSTNATEN